MNYLIFQVAPRTTPKIVRPHFFLVSLLANTITFGMASNGVISSSIKNIYISAAGDGLRNDDINSAEGQNLRGFRKGPVRAEGAPRVRHGLGPEFRPPQGELNHDE